MEAPQERERLCLILLTTTPNTPDLRLLRDGAATLGVDIDEDAGRLAIVRAMCDYVTGGVFEALGDDVAIEALTNTLRLIGPPPRQATPPPAEQQQDLLQDFLNANLRPADPVRVQQNQPNPVLGVKLEDEEVRVKKIIKLNEFKIKGTVGMPGEAGMLDFRNLSYQIRGAIDRDYDEKEICIAVVQSIKPGLQLRGYLEGLTDLTMNVLIKRLRLHFKVKDASTMFQEMEQTVQSEDESDETYCYRMMRLKQDVLLLSKQETHPFNEDRVQTRFQHALYTGLKNEGVRQQLKSLLKTRSLPVTDDELLEKISEINLEETEHKEKLRKKSKETKEAKVNALQAEEKVSKEKTNKDMMAQFAKMHAEQMSQMTTAFTNMLQAAGGFGGQGGGRRGACEVCIAGNVYRCTHCLRCTGEGHKIAECQLSATDAAAIRASRVAAARAQAPAPAAAPNPPNPPNPLNPLQAPYQQRPPLNR